MLYFANPLTGKSGLESEILDMVRTMSELQTSITLVCARSLDPIADRDLDKLMHVAGVRVQRVPLHLPFYLDASLDSADVPEYFLSIPAFCMRSIAATVRVVVNQEIKHAIIWHSFIAFPVAICLRLLGVKVFGYGHPLSGVGVKRLFAGWPKSKVLRIPQLVGSTAISAVEGFVLACYSWFRVSSPSQANDLQLRRFCGKKMGVIPPGLRLSDIPYSTNQNELGIAYFGALEDWWDIESLINGFSEISPEFPSASLHIFGGGSKESRLRERVAALEPTVRRRIYFHGPVPREELLNQFHKFGIAVVPLLYSPSNGSVPMKLIEAAAAGKTIIGTATPGIPEYFTNRALLIPPGDEKAMADALRQVLESPQLRRELSSKAREIAYRFESKLVCAQFLEQVFK
jgi:glycosyltransferase involved in cell wall biosynthesis